MKIKKKVKGKVPKYWGGGDVANAGAMALRSANSAGSNGWDNSQTTNSFGTQYGQNLKSLIPGLATSIGTIGSSEQSTPVKTGQIINSIGDTAASAVPGFGEYYGMIRQSSKGIQDAIPGDTKIDPKTGISYTKKSNTFGQGMNTVLEPAHSQASATWAKAAAATSSKDKAKYAFEGIGDMFGLTTIPKMIANAMGKDDDTSNYNRLKNSETRTNADTSTFAYGGGLNKYGGGGGNQLDEYKLAPHSMQNPNVANTHLDGRPIQIDKNETVFRQKDGDYVYSDTLEASPGNTFADISKKIKNQYKKLSYDSIAKDTEVDELKALSVKNDLAKQMKEMQNHAEKFKFGGSMSKAQYSKGGDNGSGGDIYDTVQGANAYRYYLSKFNTDGEEPVVTDGSSVNWASKGISDQPIVTEQPMNYKLHNTLYDYKNNKKILPSNNPVVTSTATKSNDIPEQKDSNKWGMNGDQMQLAGMLPSIAYNAGMAMQPADKEKALYNPYQDKVKDLYTSRYFNEQPIINENQLDFNKGRADIDGLSTNTRNANLVALNSSMMEANSKARLEGQKINNQYKGELGQVLDNLGQQRVVEDRRVSDINAQNKGRKQLFGATAATQSGQALTEAGKVKNQKVTNQIELSALNNIYADFGTKYKNMDDFYKNASIDELIAFNKYQEQNSTPRMTVKKRKK